MQSLQTEEDLVRDFTLIGLKPEMTVMVHSSLSSIGWVIGGAPTVVRALVSVIGQEGTLVMPAATPNGADPSTWLDSSLPSQWLPKIRDHLPVFDPQTTPTTMGAIAETFRTWPDTQRSNHPIESVCARGNNASTIIEKHPLAFSEGPGGPFEKLYELDCYILLLGVGFNRCTALHFAESLSSKRRTKTHKFPVINNGQWFWKEVENVADDNSTHFPKVGEHFMHSGAVQKGMVGDAESLLFNVRELVDFAKQYFDDVL